jgi:predicted transcriptional regulator
MAHGPGLGRNRTKLGKFIDNRGISQGELAKSADKSRNTIADLCDGDKQISANEDTQIKIISALRRRGYDVRPEDFW